MRRLGQVRNSCCKAGWLGCEGLAVVQSVLRASCINIRRGIHHMPLQVLREHATAQAANGTAPTASDSSSPSE